MGKDVLVLMDNTTAMFYINRHGGACSSPSTPSAVGVLHSAFNPPQHFSPPGSAEPAGGLPQQVFLQSPRVVPSPGCGEGRIPAVGDTPCRPVCNQVQQKGSPVLLPTRPHSGFYYRNLSATVDGTSLLSFSPYPAHAQSTAKDQAGPRPGHSGSPSMVLPTLVSTLLRLSVATPVLLPLPQDLISQDHSRCSTQT